MLATTTIDINESNGTVEFLIKWKGMFPGSFSARTTRSNKISIELKPDPQDTRGRPIYLKSSIYLKNILSENRYSAAAPSYSSNNQTFFYMGLTYGIQDFSPSIEYFLKTFLYISKCNHATLKQTAFKEKQLYEQLKFIKQKIVIEDTTMIKIMNFFDLILYDTLALAQTPIQAQSAI